MVFGLFSQSRYLCIDIQSDHVYFAVVRKKDDFFEIDFTQKVFIEGGVFEGNQIKAPGRVADALHEVKKKFGSISVLVSIPEIFSYTGLLPGEIYASHKDVQKAIEERISGPVYAWRYTFKKNILPRTVIHTANKEVCDALYSLVKNSGFMNVVMHPRALVVAEINRAEDGILIDVGTNQISLFSLDGAHTLSFSTIPYGSDTLGKKIQNRFSLTPNEVVEVLDAYGTDVLPRKEGHVVHGIVHTFIVPLADEIRSLVARRAEYGLESVKQLFVSGTIAQYSGLTEDLANITRMEADSLHVWEGVINFENYIPPIHKDESYEYVGIAGLMNVLKKGTQYEPFDLR